MLIWWFLADRDNKLQLLWIDVTPSRFQQCLMHLEFPAVYPLHVQHPYCLVCKLSFWAWGPDYASEVVYSVCQTCMDCRIQLPQLRHQEGVTWFQAVPQANMRFGQGRGVKIHKYTTVDFKLLGLTKKIKHCVQQFESFNGSMVNPQHKSTFLERGECPELLFDCTMKLSSRWICFGRLPNHLPPRYWATSFFCPRPLCTLCLSFASVPLLAVILHRLK